ncbi:carboxypeptidase B-like [Hyposmocoma kahamanoa]|uniref:carboxypeptidase B-like n=1 Tax=Hyposmocoma kahamanoa TaxID=1477025 RepID=UPI000E6DA2B3|nr:carboxypeptidase B-like [Hyposmocoma kahamanoa]
MLSTKMYKTIFILCLSFFAVLAKHEFYDGHTLYNIVVKDVQQAELVNELGYQIPIDIWTYAKPGQPGQILVSKEDKQQFLDALHDAGVAYSILTENIRESLELEEERLAAAAKQKNERSTFGLDFETIHRYEVVDAYLEELGTRFPHYVRVESAGRSVQGRDIKYLKISTSHFQNDTKPVVMLQSLLHAREWITLPSTLYAIEKLVIDVTERDLVDNIDWIIMPIVNPDGYEWSHTDTRFWRKNRRVGLLPGDTCVGVDLNRNFDAFWGTASSSNVCSDTYHGPSAFSEPETINIREILRPYMSRLALYIDIHSHGSMILYGFGNGQLPPNGLILHVVGVAMAQAIDEVKWAEKPNYVVGNIVAILYRASGGSSDWAQLAGASLAYTYELPSYRGQSGLNGFLVDPDFIEQAAYETWEGLKAGARQAATAFYRQIAEK